MVRSAAPHFVGEQDTVVVRDDRVAGVYALRGTVLYPRFDVHGDGFDPAADRPWMRVVAGRLRNVDGIPRHAAPFSMGLDSARRVVAVLGQFETNGLGVKRWWLYDVARDAARRLRIRARPGCAVGSVAVWLNRRVYQENCRGDGRRLVFANIVVRARGRNRRVLRTSARGTLTLLLRSRSLAVIGLSSGGTLPYDRSLFRVFDRGRRCPTVVGGTDVENQVWAGIGAGTQTWVTAVAAQDGLLHYSLLGAWDIDLSGQCQASPVVRQTPPSLIPQTTVNALGSVVHGPIPNGGVAIDGRTVYYATDAEIHRLRLPAHGDAPAYH
jgi:hypothetical protein